MSNKASQDSQDNQISYRSIALQRIRGFAGTVRRAPIIPLVIITLLLIAAAFGPAIAPYSPTRISAEDSLKPPFWNSGGSFTYPLGTDRMGRDIFSRILYGARLSLGISLTVIAMGGTAGIILGLISGYLGGRTDAVIQRGVEVILSIPLILLALVIVYTLGPSITMVMFIMTPFLGARFARMVRGDTLKVKEEQFVALARVAGTSPIRIMWKHILPNVFNTIVVVATLEVGRLILVESSLSFLGVGVPPPHPAWGSMVASGRDQIVSAYWLSMLPGLAILATVLSLNLFGDWLRDTLDPKLRQI